MANSSFRSTVLQGLLDQAQIPYESIVVVDINATPVDVHITYKPAATAEQISFGDTTLASFDWRKRRALSRATVVTALQSLTTNQQNAILRNVVCDLLRNNASLAAQIDAALGTSLPVDEVDPS
jgi:hypothetical protein